MENDTQKIPRNIGVGFDSSIAWSEYYGQKPSSFEAQVRCLAHLASGQENKDVAVFVL
jgi:hypothetical protein